MKPSLHPLAPDIFSLVVAGTALQTAALAQDATSVARSDWSFRAGASARFNVKAALDTVPKATANGLYDNGFVYPDAGGTASGRTWNWGYLSPAQVAGGQLIFTRYDAVPAVGHHEPDVGGPLPGGEIIANYQMVEFEIARKPARLGFEIGYGYSGFSERLNLGAAGASTFTTDAFALGGILPPLPPYAGTAAGPGPLLPLAPASHTVVPSAAVTSFQGTLEASLHHLRLGPALGWDLTQRLSVALGVGYSAVLADASLKYVETTTFADPAVPALGSAVSLSKGQWQPGAYAELNLRYQFTRSLGVFLGGDAQYNGKLAFGNSAHQVTLDLGMTYAINAGVTIGF